MIVKSILPGALERLSVIEAEAPAREAATPMSKPHTDLIVVRDHGDKVGVLTKADIVGQIGRLMGVGCTTRVDSLMTRDVTDCRTDDVLLEGRPVIRKRGVRRVPILDEARRPSASFYAREALQARLTELEDEDKLLRDYISGVGYR